MPVNSENPKYRIFYPMWTKCRDAVEGERKVKARGTLYLPSLTGQNTEEYSAYRKRAYFYNATYRTLEAMTGAIMRKPPTVDYPDLDKLKTITDTGNDFLMFSKNVLNELITTGRVGILIDMPPGNSLSSPAYLSYYCSEDIINWKTEFVNGIEQLVLVVLKERYEEEKDEFEIEEEDRIRVLKLEDGIYYQEIHKKSKVGEKEEYVLDEEIIPQMYGSNLDFIPFIISNYREVSANLIKPPLMDLVDINFSHYRSTADLEHGRHFTSLPTAVFAGFPAENTYRIGSAIAYVSEDPAAKAYFLEYTGQGLGSLEKALEQKEYMMAIVGTRLLDVPKKGVEAAETYKMRNLGETNILSCLSIVLSAIMTQALKVVYLWENNKEKDDINIAFTLDFDAGVLDANQISALVKTYQAGGISWETLFYNLKRGEIIEPDVDEEMEQERISSNMTLIAPPSTNTPPENKTANKEEENAPPANEE